MSKHSKYPTILVIQTGTIISTDALVTLETAAMLFGVKPSALYRHAPKIVAKHGLQRVKTGRVWKYRLQSIQTVIRKCAENGRPLYVSGKFGGIKCKPPEQETESK